MGTEIERRFLIDDPDAAAARAGSSDRVEQGYVAIGDDSTQVRVRRIGDRTVLTAKRGSGASRFEHELEIAEGDFDALWELTEGRRLRKRRFVVEADAGLRYEVDVYEGELEGLAVVEVEFDSPQAADAFEPPAWFGRELTGNDRYSNLALAVEGLPAQGEG